jgi:hypothetical protein
MSQISVFPSLILPPSTPPSSPLLPSTDWTLPVLIPIIATPAPTKHDQTLVDDAAVLPRITTAPRQAHENSVRAINSSFLRNGSQQRGIPRVAPSHLHHDSRQLQLCSDLSRAVDVARPLRYLQGLRHGARGGNLCEMSTPTSVPRLIRRQLPENGYESPCPLESEDGYFGNGIHKKGEKRARFADRSGDAFFGLQRPETRDHVGRDNVESGRDEDTEVKKIGFRGRVACYTWTWFTMTMATGGIANVLHSSNKSRCLRKIVSDDLQFPTDLTG